MKEPMEIDRSNDNDRTTLVVKDNDLHLYTVSANESGEGLPYAPINFPNPGDTWTWKVGKRVSTTGYFLDRYLYPPCHLIGRGERKKSTFASKLSLEQYVHSTFPSVDVKTFFNSFSWKIPSEQLSGKIGLSASSILYGEASANSGSGFQPETVGCKAGNSACSSLVETENSSAKFMSCNICCIGQDFCRDCCCILCCKIATSAYGGYGYIKCEATVDGEYICGHISHIDCGIRAYMAGTVGGSIGLDAEYYCRLCDSRTDLGLHVMKLLQTCTTIDSLDIIKNILNIGIRLLRYSRKSSAQQLLQLIEFSMAKLEGGANLNDIFLREKDNLLTAGASTGDGMIAPKPMNEEKHQETNIPSREVLGSRYNHQIELLKLEDEVYQVLLSLRKSRMYEYNLAEEKLLAQKNRIQHLYERLEEERSSLSKQQESFVDYEASRNEVLAMVQQIKQELLKFEEMKEVAKGSGRISKEIL
ncbi:scaffold/adaptor protein [Lithospermum erythrorhizon]|uniref:Scaffold/adaptor protein n=1 Tax=Lithospermum erythrorhizon TaxID=34254 RepID=A0AAV3RJ09_LITER